MRSGLKLLELYIIGSPRRERFLMLEREHAESLMGKAAQDEYILDALLH